MSTTQVNMAIAEIDDLVQGMASNETARTQKIADGLARIIRERTFPVAAEAASDRIWYWRQASQNLGKMAAGYEDAGVERGKVFALETRASEVWRDADDLEKTLTSLAI